MNRRATFRRFAGREFEREQAACRLHANTTVVLGYSNIPLRIIEEGLAPDTPPPVQAKASASPHDAYRTPNAGLRAGHAHSGSRACKQRGRVPDSDGLRFDPSPILGYGSLCATNVDRLLLGGVKVIVWSPGIPFWRPSGEGLAGRAKVEFLMHQIKAVHQLGKLTDGLLQVATNAREIRRINAAGGVAVLLHLSGANHLNDLGILREYYRLGVRLVHCGFQDWPEEPPLQDSIRYDDPIRRLYHAGRLNEHGIRTIEEMKRLGIILDAAHLKPEGFDDVVSRLEGLPFVYSHGGCAALYADPCQRNLDDIRIQKLAQSRGVYGIGVYIAPVVGEFPVADPENQKRHDLIAQRRADRCREIDGSAPGIRAYVCRRYSVDKWGSLEEREMARRGAYVVRPSIAHVVAHMQHLRRTFGPDIVGYGPDYEHTFQYVHGLEEADKTPHLTRALLDAGFAPDEVQAAMGHNFMRVFEALLK